MFIWIKDPDDPKSAFIPSKRLECEVAVERTKNGRWVFAAYEYGTLDQLGLGPERKHHITAQEDAEQWYERWICEGKSEPVEVKWRN